MRVYQKGKDYFGYYWRVGIGKGGLNIRFDLDCVDLVAGVSCGWTDGGYINLKIFNFSFTYFFKVYWD
jgi:hypothetical protein